MCALKFGLALGYWDPQICIERSVFAEKCGFHSVWPPDHIITPDPQVGVRPGASIPEVYSLLTAIGMKTRRLMLASCVSDPIRRHPAQTAQTAVTLDRITGGRAILGIGAGELMNFRMFGINTNLSLRRLREAVEVIKLLLESSPERPVNYQGTIFQLKNAFLQISSVQKPRLPVYIGALGPKNKELTGEIADGWCTWLQTTETLKEDLGYIERGARKTGRNADEIDVAVSIPVAISRDPRKLEPAINGVKRELILERRTFMRMGYETPFDENLSIQLVLPSPYFLRRLEGAKASVPDEVVERVSAFGPMDHVIERIEAFVKAGAKTVVLENYGPDFNRTMRLLGRQIIPYFA